MDETDRQAETGRWGLAAECSLALLITALYLPHTVVSVPATVALGIIFISTLVVFFTWRGWRMRIRRYAVSDYPKGILSHPIIWVPWALLMGLPIWSYSVLGQWPGYKTLMTILWAVTFGLSTWGIVNRARKTGSQTSANRHS